MGTFTFARCPVIMHFLLSVLLILAPSDAFAGQSSGTGKITKLNIPRSGAYMVVWFDQPIVNPDQCGGAQFYMAELTGTESGRFVSAVMSAFLAGKPVHFWIAGCTANPYWGATQPVMYDVYVEP